MILRFPRPQPIVLSTVYLLNYPDSVRYEVMIDTLIANINHKVKHLIGAVLLHKCLCRHM